MAKIDVISFLRTQVPAEKTDYYEVYNKSLAPALVVNSLIELHIALAGNPRLRQCAICYEIQDEQEKWTCVCRAVREKGQRYTQLAALMAPSSDFEKGKISPLALGAKSEWAEIFNSKQVNAVTIRAKSNKYSLPENIADALNSDTIQAFHWPQDCASIELLVDAVRIAQEAIPNSAALSRCIVLGVPGDLVRPSFLRPTIWVASKPEEQQEPRQSERGLMFDAVSGAIIATADKVAASSGEPIWRNRVWNQLQDVRREWSKIRKDKDEEFTTRQVRRLYRRYKDIVDLEALTFLDREAQLAVNGLAAQLADGFKAHTQNASHDSHSSQDGNEKHWTDYLLPIGFGVLGVLLLVVVILVIRERFVVPATPPPAPPVAQPGGPSPNKPPHTGGGKPRKPKSTDAATVTSIDIQGKRVIATDETVTGTVRLSKAAGKDIDVSLSSGPQIRLAQNSITIPAGKAAAEFQFTGGEPTGDKPAALKATVGDSGQTAHITVVPAIEIRIDGRRHVAGDTVKGEVVLAHPAGDAGVEVIMSTDGPGAFPDPPSVDIEKGRTSGSFNVSTTREMGKASITVNASLTEGGSATKKVNIVAP